MPKIVIEIESKYVDAAEKILNLIEDIARVVGEDRPEFKVKIKRGE